MPFDIEGARKAGYSDAEIVEHLAADSKFDVQAARKAGYSDAELLQHLRAPAASFDKPLQNQSLGAQAGLTARSMLKGGAGIVQPFVEPLRYATDKLYSGLTGKESTSRPLTMLADQLSDTMGLPTPETAQERMVGKGVEFGTGGYGLAKASTAASNWLAQRAPGVAQQVLGRLGQQPVAQAAAGAGGGFAGQHAAEGGSDAVGQFGSAVLGSLGTAGALGAGKSAVRLGQQMLPTSQGQMQQIERQINIILQQQGIDPATITPAMRTMLREQVARATKIGGNLNPAAVGRLADYARLGATPTRGRVSLDPYDVTQEANASKIAAATGQRGGLPEIAQQNNARLIDIADEMGGARPPDPAGYGGAAVGAIRGHDARLNAAVNQLYEAAKTSAGRPVPLDAGHWTRTANAALNREMVGSQLPGDIVRVMNDVAVGKTPLTVEVAEQVKSALAKIIRDNTENGRVRQAAGLVRQALDDTPIWNPPANPGNLPGVPGSIPPSVAALGQDAINAFNRARGAARSRFNWQESAPGITRALEPNVNADTFIANNIISRGASLEHVQRAARVINADPAARDAVRTQIVQHLRAQALGKGGTSATGNFSGRGLQEALDQIGDRKLALFFEPGEIARLRSAARVGAYEVFQPRGSAVNNSNTGAAIASLISGLADRVGPLASKIPFGKAAVTEPLESLNAWVQQRPSQDIARGLTSADPTQASAMERLLLPLGLLSTGQPNQ